MKLLSSIKLRPLNKAEQKLIERFGISMQKNFKKFRQIDRKRMQAVANARTIVLD